VVVKVALDKNTKRVYYSSSFKWIDLSQPEKQRGTCNEEDVQPARYPDGATDCCVGSHVVAFFPISNGVK
jgi:hypothetical protein